MKKLMMVSASLTFMMLAGVAQANEAGTTTVTTTTTTSAASVQQPAQKKPGLLKGARIVPDTAAAPASAKGNTFKKDDQGYSKMSTYNVVNDQNKPITNDWLRPKSWRIGYKNQNRTPINE